jgi:hypothetical protein
MKLSNKKIEYLILSLILLLGLFLRLFNYSEFSLSNDELSAIYRCNYNSFHDLIQQGVAIDYHPAGVQTFLYYWIKTFGNSVASVRFPFVIFGTLAILFTYLFSRRWFGSTTSLLSAIAIAFMPFTVIFSQIARPYSSGLMLSMLLVWLWSIVLFPKEKEKKHIWIFSLLLGIALALNLYNHYFSGLLAFIIGITGVLFLNKRNYKSYLASLIIGSILFLPHISMSLHHMSKGGLSSWLAAPHWNWPIEHLKMIFRNWLLLGSLIILVSFLHISGKRQKSLLKIRVVIFSFFVIPLLIGLFYSILVNPVLQHSILIFSLPFLIIWIFSFVSDELSQKIQIGAMLITASIFYGGIPSKSNHPMIDIQDFKGMAQTLKEWNKENKNSSVIRIMESNSPNYINYYLDKDTSEIHFAQWKIRDEQDLMQLKNILDSSQSNFLEYIILAPDNKLALRMMINKFPYLIKQKYFADNCHAYLMEKEPIKPGFNLKKLPQKFVSHFESPTDSLIQLQQITYSDGLTYQFGDYEKRFANTLDFKVNVFIQIKYDSIPKHIQMVFQIDNTDGSKEFWTSIPLRYFIDQDSIQDIYFQQKLPELNSSAKSLKVYIWNPDNETMEYKNLHIYLNADDF